jgi:putative hydroxymethylpyrimidine transport system substrate-binding protein
VPRRSIAASLLTLRQRIVSSAPVRHVIALVALLLVAAAAVTGCGATGSGSAPNADATLLLDFQPNAVHSGIYMAIERGYDTALGVRLHVRVPGSSTDAVKLLASGRTDLAVLDIHDLALAREAGSDLVGVMALVQTPLAAVFAQPPNRTPRDLEGKRVGVTGLPSDDAVLRSIVAGAGGDPNKVRATTIGFTAVRSMLTGRVAGATGFWNVEGVALHAKRPKIREFRVDEYGAPAYPELVLAVTRETLQDRTSLVRASVAALARGYEEVLSDPESGVNTLVEAVGGLDRDQVQRELDAVSPSFTAGARGFGDLDRGRLQAWAQWEQRFGITRRAPDVALAFDGRFVPAPGRD